MAYRPSSEEFASPEPIHEILLSMEPNELRALSRHLRDTYDLLHQERPLLAYSLPHHPTPLLRARCERSPSAVTLPNCSILLPTRSDLLHTAYPISTLIDGTLFNDESFPRAISETRAVVCARLRKADGMVGVLVVRVPPQACAV